MTLKILRSYSKLTAVDYRRKLFHFIPIEFLILIASCVLSSAVSADAADATVTATVNEQLNIDLTLNISNVQTPVISLPNQPKNGQATVNGLSVTYTPDTNFIGEDNFVYSVTDNSTGAPAGTATVTVNVIAGGTPVSQTLSPQQAMNNYLNFVCVQNQPSVLMTPLCNEYNNATPGERQILLNELSPKEVAAQKQFSNLMAIEQLDNVRRRLAALRRGQRGLDVNTLSLNNHGDILTGEQLAANIIPDIQGGAASSDDNQLGNNLGIFLGGNIGGGDQEETVAEDGFDFSTYGLTAGVDYRLTDRWVLGGALGYSNNSTDINNNGGKLDITGFSLLAYGSYYRSTSLFVDAILSYQSHEFEASRNINYNFNFPTPTTASSTTDSNMLTMSLGAGYEVFYAKGFSTTLLGNLDYLNSTIEGYQESNAGTLNLAIAERDTEQLTSSVGAQATYAFSQSWGVLIPQLDIHWKHEFIDDAEIIRGTFVGDTSNSTFQFNSNKPDANYFKLGIGLTAVVPGGNTGYVQLEKTLDKDNFSDYNLAAGFRFEI